MKKSVIILSLFLFFLVYNVNAVTVDETNTITIENETYRFAHEMNFTEINIERTNVTFNLTTFNVSSPNDINITIHQIANYSTINFTSNVTSSCLVWFNFSGLLTSYNYSILYNGTYNQTVETNADGDLSFNYIHTLGNHTLLIRSSTSQVRILAGEDVPDILNISESVITILGIVLIFGSLMILIGVIMKEWLK